MLAPNATESTIAMMRIALIKPFPFSKSVYRFIFGVLWSDIYVGVCVYHRFALSTVLSHVTAI